MIFLRAILFFTTFYTFSDLSYSQVETTVINNQQCLMNSFYSCNGSLNCEAKNFLINLKNTVPSCESLQINESINKDTIDGILYGMKRSNMNEITHVKLPLSLVEKVLNYLAEKPFKEVNNLLINLKQEADKSYGEQQEEINKKKSSSTD